MPRLTHNALLTKMGEKVFKKAPPPLLFKNPVFVPKLLTPLRKKQGVY